ncbi:pre-mRNA-processing protein 40A-like [Phragmites australis]|uniref:pre-mRNA-processing protein 40A-like n=1 Tax=Phragmites australis TaxID=29695 RepID=UPI002D766E2A|nr:pre-mRNA-processing protein 40A-like [Phragmites australis]
MASNMQPSGLPQPPRPSMMGSSAPPQNLGPPMPMQFRPVGPPQQPPQFMQPAAQQFRPVGQPMPGANIGMPGQMQHFAQPGQHLPHSDQVPPSSQAVPMAYQPARPMSSAPLQLQQQAAYHGGHLPTMGAPMPPPSYTYQPTSVPPVMQPWGTAPGQSVPHVTALVQPGHQPVSAPATLPSVNSSQPSSLDWQEHTATNGKKYYFNKKTRQSSWEKPVELMTHLERADASTEWKEFTTPEGRKYYYNKVTKQSKWTIPDQLKVARELAEKASNQQPDQETGTTAGALVGSTSAEPSTVPANQSSSAVGIIASSLHDASGNSVPPDAGPSNNVDNTSSSSNVSMQNGGPSTAVVPVTRSTEVTLVATDAGTSRTYNMSLPFRLHNNDNSSIVSAADTEDGTSAADLEEAKKTMPVAGKINVMPLEEKSSEEEPAVYANKLDAKNAFKSLLESVNVESDWTWDQAMRVIINDNRYGALKTLGERKQAFNEYLNQRKKFEAEEKRVKQRKARDDFLAMLEECKELTSSTRWSKAILMFEDAERFKAVERPREREDLFENYVVELHKKEKAKAAEEHKRHVAEYRAFLESCDFIKATTQWRKVQERLEDDERCSRLEKIDRLDIFQEYIRHLEKEDEEQKRIQKEQARKRERKNRDEFRKMLEEHVADGTLTARTWWRDYCTQIKESHAYLAVASNSSGSTPKELFDDVMEELDKQYQDDKAQIKAAVKSGKIPMMTSWALEEFQTAVVEDDTLKGISTINIKLIYDDQIERFREKEQKEAKKRQRLGENFSDLLYSIKEISASSTWDDSKQLFEDSQEFRALDSEIYAKELFEECVVHLKERLKEKERLREEEKAKREKEREEKEREKEKEKERKEKERKEKERDREKEREKEKGKDRSRRDDMEIDGADVDTHGSKDKKREKDKEKKHKRRYHDTDDVSSERDDKGYSKKSRRHSSDRKKSRKHTHTSDSDSENRHKRHKKDRDSCRRNGAHELEDGELGEDGEVH